MAFDPSLIAGRLNGVIDFDDEEPFDPILIAGNENGEDDEDDDGNEIEGEDDEADAKLAALLPEPILILGNENDSHKAPKMQIIVDTTNNFILINLVEL